MGRIGTFIRNNLAAGIIALAPFGATLYLLIFFFGVFDRLFGTLPERIIGMKIPGVGVIFGLVIIFLTGILVKTYFAKKLITLFEDILRRIPILRAFYTSTKQLIEIFGGSKKGFSGKPVIVEFPREGAFAIGFLLGTSSRVFSDNIKKDLVNVFVPSTPNPTTGFFIMVDRSRVWDIGMSFETAMKVVMSAGTVDISKEVKPFA
jgi:uncharacterized membrane protein